MVMNRSFWQGKKVLVTGHTGFKGSWLCLWLESLGAVVTGYSLAPDNDTNLFEKAQIENGMTSVISDLANFELLKACFSDQQPDIVFHLAAQALVRESYSSPRLTYATNVMGTLNVLEACRECKSVRAILLVSTDKCYENNEWHWGYRESDPLGGHDPYSSSKACMEILTASYRRSFFNPEAYTDHNVAIATARAGNVIGGGDWAKDRLVPDTLNAIHNNQPIALRYPAAIRPWQHVLEPLSGYLALAEKLYTEGVQYAQAWNFGPAPESAKSVSWITQFLVNNYPADIKISEDKHEFVHEAQYLKLDCSKANDILKWQPKWDLPTALLKVIEWSKGVQQGEDPRTICLRQINAYEAAVKGQA
jgi:CDP-glucose 4,6-dehydratase